LCDRCGLSQQDLHKHLQNCPGAAADTYHRIQLYECTFCEENFRTHIQLELHLNSDHQCKICSFRGSRENLNLHRAHHDLDLEIWNLERVSLFFQI